MFTKNRAYISIFALSLLILGGCSSTNDTPYATNTRPKPAGFEVKFLVGSALKEFCNQAATKFNQQKPKLDNGKAFYLSCEAKGSGDVVNETLSLAQQLQNGSLPADSPQFPTLLSVDGEIYHSQLIYQVQQIFPGQNYIPEITDAPLLAHSPMVFMVEEEIAPGIEKQANLYQALITATTHQDLDPNSSVLPIKFVHTAPTRSNSGLQTLVTQFVAVSGKRPEELTVADVETYQSQVQKIQSKITRYGTSTSSLAKDMVNYGIFWASVASVYESIVIQANSSNNNTVYRAIYPQATFTSNMRVIYQMLLG